MNKLYFLGAITLMVLGCKDKKTEDKVVTEPAYYSEPYRPQFHFSPEANWMNDPNGLVYQDGVYHLFYQYYPDDTVWGPMHWGHAVSKDLVRWEHKPIALYPDEHGLIFSGSAVVDSQNTSGFAKNGETPLVAIFTYHDMDGEKAGRTDFQTQGIAYTLDNGDTWTKFKGNPVIGNEGIKDFRDPKVTWHEASKRWILTLVAGDHAQFYTSPNLKDWTLTGEFGKDYGAHGGVWECPDLFPLQVDGENESKWVLIISINPGAPNGGSGTQYFIGDFDGKTFTTDQKEPKWIDYGTDNYAGVTYNNEPNGDRIFIGWMSNWQYARDTPTKKWRSSMTVPRKLTLQKIGMDYYLTNFPISGIDGLASSELTKSWEVGSSETATQTINGLDQSSIQLKTASKDFSIVYGNSLGEKVVLTLNAGRNQFLVDRSASGKIDFQEDFGNKTHVAPLQLLNGDPVEMEILLDKSSMEVFINGGLLVMTEQVFPNEPYNSITVENNDPEANVIVESIKKMESIW
ncbi:glycoside hydrolase family 32 protein [Flagellimonas sediminis]|uniref:Glycoside hydrolase family 32 protein n=1 Tax=Flagellimonas sediminis TaxID=2696468 RepID=A0A6I5KTT7_9FLAO|nr:glycoside hydrolase family 32 protein [Allomuricauda sediminis]NDV44286.1 glycoside hydrolase family 32 protein [Allomuricauda sediminis]